MEESTTFDEAFVGNEAKFPSYTLCPVDNVHSNNSIESFEDVTEEIENVKRNFKINYAEFKQYEETKRINETYNQSLNNDWYFAPKTSPFPPHETVVCLIMAPYRAHKNNPDWYYTVSHSRHVRKGGGQLPPRYWRIKRRRQAAAARRITTCPPRLCDMPDSNYEMIINYI